MTSGVYSQCDTEVEPTEEDEKQREEQQKEESQRRPAGGETTSYDTDQKSVSHMVLLLCFRFTF